MKIIFFNHYHKGDLFTCKKFVQQIKDCLPENEYEYWHFNHPKTVLDVDVPLTNTPHQLKDKVRFYKDGDVVAVNTWIGAWEEIFAKYDGANMKSIYFSWKEIFKFFSLELDDRIENYIPEVNYNVFNISHINEYVKDNKKKKILVCNGIPMSNQSFSDDMGTIINLFASDNPQVDFICTKKVKTNLSNVLNTDDIIKDTEIFSGYKPFWNDRALNTCDLNEISYLSTFCDAVVGKNSGPFTFCSTKNNLFDPKKIFMWFSHNDTENLIYGTNASCKYKQSTDYSEKNIINNFEWVLTEL